ncbi:299_t:CDS:2 [Rhizophagus irregularis]|nr:299_t:CDS:2 [Rhizophagus irregularis]
MVKASDYTCFVGYNIYLAKPATTEEGNPRNRSPESASVNLQEQEKIGS